jgi:hypothetical protein
MSQENVQLTYRFYDAFNHRHLAAVLALMDDDVESNSIIAAMEGGYHGHDGARRLWEDALNALPDLTLEPVEVRDLGDLTVALVRVAGHGARSDIPAAQALWYVGRWRHGKCVWWSDFYTEQEALEAVRLAEQDAHADS